MAPGEATRVRLGAPRGTPRVSRTSTTDALKPASPAGDPSVQAQTDAGTAADAEQRARAILAQKLSSLMPALSSGARARLRQKTLAALTELVGDATVRVRAAIADVVKDMPDAPHGVILRLARDDYAEVFEPVIRLSPMLTADDLVSLIAAAPSAATCIAVARRPAIAAAVSDAIAAGGIDDAILALLMNNSAQIRESTLDSLVERSVEHPEWHDPLVHRPVLSGQSIKTLSGIVADHLLERLADRGDIEPILAAELRARVSTRLRQSPEQTEALPKSTRPTEAELLAAARDGDVHEAVAMLAAAADVPLPAVRHAMTLRSAKGLVSLSWKAGFSMRAGYAMQVLLAGLSPGAVIRPGPGNSFPLSVQEMNWQVRFLSGKSP